MRVFRQNIVIDGDSYGKLIARVRSLGAKSAHPPSKASNSASSNSVAVPRGGTLADPTGATTALGDAQELYEKTVEVYTTEYEDSVEEVLNEVNLRRSGKAVLRAIVQQITNLAVTPWLGKGSIDSPNAITRAIKAADATPRGEPVRDARGNVVDPTRTGTGRGSSAEIEFLPYKCASGVEGAKEQADPSKHAAGTLPDEIIVHELVHALLFMSGKSYSSPVPNQHLYDNQDDFFAILIANVYRSECGRLESRLHHYGFESDELKSGKFLRTWENRYTVRKLRRDLPSLFSDLHDVRADFNPFRRMLDI
ncbi:MAG TPA: hypothetical protein VFB63_10170 [Bryobacteraceae bacterium]|nr:hypothetical protein [Bryobacteraceae bacterium]